MLKCILILVFVAFTNTQWYFQENTNVLDYTWTHLKELAYDTADLFLVQVYEHQNDKCRNFSKKYEKIAEGLRGFARVVAVDINQIFEDFSVPALPAFGIFSTNRYEMAMFKGRKTVRNLVDAVFEAAEKMTTRELTRSLDLVNPVALQNYNYNDWVLEEMGIWFVAFIDRDGGTMATIWDEVSRIMKIKANFGYMDTIISKRYNFEYGVDEESAIVCLPRGYKRFERGIRYTGNILLNDILLWVTSMINKPPDVLQLTGKMIFISTCSDYVDCIILFIPERIVCSSECRQQYLNLLERLSHKFLNYTTSWLWSEANTQLHLEKLFEIKHTYPTLVMLNFQILNYTALRDLDVNDQPRIEEFIDNVAKGNDKAPPYGLAHTIKFSLIADVEPVNEICNDC